jgi:hypothetical protein
MLKHIFFEFLLYENTIQFFFLIFERLACMYENKIFFLFIIFCNVSTKTEYFNTGIISLRYKNTNQY